MEHPKFAGYVLLNEDEYKKSFQIKNKDIVLEYHNSPSFDYMHIVGGYSLWNQPFSDISDLHDLDLDLESGYMAYCCVLLIDLYVHIKFCSNRKIFCGWTGGQTLSGYQ